MDIEVCFLTSNLSYFLLSSISYCLTMTDIILGAEDWKIKNQALSEGMETQTHNLNTRTVFKDSPTLFKYSALAG